MFDKRTIRVNGVDVEVNPASLVISDIDDAHRRSASEMAFWASVAGAAEREQIEADAYYRRWRGQLKVKLMEHDSKAAEHKITAQIEATDEFYKLKQAMAVAADNVRTAQYMYGAWEKRVNASQSLGARERGEVAAIPKSVTRESAPPKPSNTLPGPEGKQKLKGILGKKRG
jgi:hypothetical protein